MYSANDETKTAKAENRTKSKSLFAKIYFRIRKLAAISSKEKRKKKKHQKYKKYQKNVAQTQTSCTKLGYVVAKFGYVQNI